MADFDALKVLLVKAEDPVRKIMIEFPNVEVLPDQAFMNGNALTSVNLPKATGVGMFMFLGCGALESVNLPKTISIGQYVFASFNALKTMTIATGSTVLETICYRTFDDVDATTLAGIKVTTGSEENKAKFVAVGITAGNITVQ